MRSGADFGSLKAALTRWARVSIGMYSTSTSGSSWAFSKAATTESTTFSFGLLPTSWKSQTRRVPVCSSLSEEVLPDVWGGAGADDDGCQQDGQSGGELHGVFLRARCKSCNDGFALHNTPEAREWMNSSTRGLNHSVTSGRSPRNDT
jgi:hypothetical protein